LKKMYSKTTDYKAWGIYDLYIYCINYKRLL
jgi:hypothetical protein